MLVVAGSTTFLAAVAALCAWVVGEKLAADRSTWLSWRRLFAALVITAGARAGLLLAYLPLRIEEGPSLVLLFEATQVASFGLVAWSMLTLAGHSGRGGSRVRFYADGGLVVAASATLLFYPQNVPSFELQGTVLTGSAVFAIRSAQNLILVLALAALLLRRGAGLRPSAFALTAAISSMLGGNLVATYSSAPSLLDTTPQFLLHSLAFICFGLAALSRLKEESDPSTLGVEWQGRTPALFPYIISGGLISVVLAQVWLDKEILLNQPVVSVGAVGVGLLLRQLLLAKEEEPQTVRDITLTEEDRLHALISNSSDLILVVNPDGAVRYLSPSVRRVLGHDVKAMWGPSFLEFVHPEDLAGIRALLRQSAREITGVSLRGEWRIRDYTGKWLYVEGVITNHLQEPGIGGLLLNVRDVTERKVLEGKLIHQALHDPLTGLANRGLLLNRAAKALAKATANQEQVALLFLDLDDFKQVNDTLGHAEGDRLLQEIALRLQMTCRAGDTVARLGGDEFAVLLLEAAGFDTALRVAERILEELRAPYAMLRGRIRPSTSIGIAVVGGEVNAQELLRRADVAMYAAKARGKDNLCLFDSTMDRPLQERLRLEGDLRDSVRRWSLAVYYQPIMALESGEIAGVEALLRWNHPETGLLLPGEFLPLAEATGLMVSIGRRVLLESCIEVSHWLARSPASDLFVCVNLSGPELRDPELLVFVQEALKRSNLHPERLVLEITENALLGDQTATSATLRQLEDLGVRIAIDDFGTHYSSLSYLKNLPVHLLKLDRSFVADLTTDPRSNQIVRAVSDLARALEVQLIAEGIEKAEQRDELLRMGCHYGQGFYYSTPKPCYEFRERFGGIRSDLHFGMEEGEQAFRLVDGGAQGVQVPQLLAFSAEPLAYTRPETHECEVCGRHVSFRSEEVRRMRQAGQPLCCAEHSTGLWIDGIL